MPRVLEAIPVARRGRKSASIRKGSRSEQGTLQARRTGGRLDGKRQLPPGSRVRDLRPRLTVPSRRSQGRHRKPGRHSCLPSEGLRPLLPKCFPPLSRLPSPAKSSSRKFKSQADGMPLNAEPRRD